MFLSPFVRLAPLALLASLAVACVVQSDPPPPPASTTVPGAPVGGGTTSPASPLLVDVDTGQTMEAAPGQGVGVFVEYVAGGHWHVWWTCDTNVNPAHQPCTFAIAVSAQTGSVKNATSDRAELASSLVTGPASVALTTTTSTGVDGIRFDTDPGAIITLDAALNGQRDGGYLFFVQQGKVNGGYTGALSNPLMLEGSTP